MKLRKLDPRTIMIPETRVTARFDEETMAMFKKSIADAGQVAPIICIIVDGAPVLVDGLHRLQEAVANKRPTIDVAIMEGDMVDVLTKNIYLDHLRGKTPVSEMANVIETLWKEYQLDSEKIAEKTGMSRDYIEKLMSLTQLSPLIRAALDQETIKVGHGYELTRIKDPGKQEAVFHQLVMYRWNVKELGTYIDEVLKIVEAPPAPPGPGEPPAPRRIKCVYCGQEKEVTEIANPNTCRECSFIMFQSIAAARAELDRDKNSTHEGTKIP